LVDSRERERLLGGRGDKRKWNYIVKNEERRERGIYSIIGMVFEEGLRVEG
jgi:hypothetical protein